MDAILFSRVQVGGCFLSSSIFLISSIFVGWRVSKSFNRMELSSLFESIFSTMGYVKPENIDLNNKNCLFYDSHGQGYTGGNDLSGYLSCENLLI